MSKMNAEYDPVVIKYCLLFIWNIKEKKKWFKHVIPDLTLL